MTIKVVFIPVFKSFRLLLSVVRDSYDQVEVAREILHPCPEEENI